jgi:cyclic pyranopterin phosphate synthase
MRDSFGRELNYVRVSVTDRCNYRCRYCMPRDGVGWIPHGEILSYEAILFLIEVLREMGVKKVRFTGGEPFVRKGMLPFLERARAAFPDLFLALTTNGSTLERDAPSLARLGIPLNVSLDTLDPERFAAMTRTGSLPEVLRGIDALLLAGFPAGLLKFNSVVIRGFNDGEVGVLAEYAGRRGLTPRFIEFMPLDKRLWKEEGFVPFSEILRKLARGWTRERGEAENSLSGPAVYYVNAATGRRVGFISAMSSHFCASCNRLRVTSTGGARPCLFRSAEVPLAEVLRRRDAEGTRAALLAAAALKPETGMTRRDGSPMNRIGG